MSGVLFSEEQFMSLIRAGSTMTAAELVARIPSYLAEWSGNRGIFEDDLTLVVVDVL